MVIFQYHQLEILIILNFVCVNWFVYQMLVLQATASEYFRRNIPIDISPEEQQIKQFTEECWLCEEPFSSSVDFSKSCEKLFEDHEKMSEVKDHDHLIDKYRTAAHTKCNLH